MAKRVKKSAAGGPGPKRKRQDQAAAATGRFIAAVDVGSSSVRMCVAEVLADGGVRPVETLMAPVRLGADTFSRGKLGSESIRAACQVLADFRKALANYNVQEIRAVATSAVREAANADTFVDRVQSTTGLRLEVLEGTEETRLVYGVLQKNLQTIANFRQTESLLMDLSSGSTEVTVFHKGRIVLCETLRMGTLWLREVLGSVPRGKFGRLIEPFVENIVDSIHRRVPLKALRNFLVISPDLWRLHLGRGGPAGIEVISRAAFEQAVEEVTGLATFDLIDRYGLQAEEAELLSPALVAIHTFLAGTQAENLVLLNVNLVDLLLAQMAGGARVEAAAEADFQEQIASCAVGIGRKYHFDEAHSLHVTDLALQLFDQLQALHGLSPADRTLLRTSGILHDIGLYISARMHHKHSMYLVSHSECFGLTTEQMHLVSVICRYHRRATPRPQHLEYASLSRDNRLRVSKLAAILRMADSLDRSHDAAIRQVRCEVEENQLVLDVQTEADTVLDELSLANKADLFESLYGLPVVLRRRAGG
jgi:exopolyphosphatase/guanosine-5'-triphosphate,3'-diphosphate pyrophosphatase